MTIQTMEIKDFESLIRRVVREEIRSIIQESAQDGEIGEVGVENDMGNKSFQASLDKVMKSHKKVLDALA